MALKDLIIEVQGSLLHELAEAEQDDTFTNFSSTIQTAIRTRRKAISVLNDLYLRTEEEEAENHADRDEEAIAAAQPGSSPPGPVSRKQTMDEEPAKERSRFKLWSRRSSTDISKQKQRNDRRSKEVDTPPTEPPSANVTRQSNASFSNVTRRSTWVTISPPTSPQGIRPLNKANDFGGFCKGAWYAQSLNLAKAIGKPSLRSYGWAFHCTKCSYRLQADVRDKNSPRFDDRVYRTEDVRFRLLFLLKSHLPQKNFKDSRQYGCLLCALAGGVAKTCTGEEHLIEHVRTHALQSFGGTLLAGPVSVGVDSVLTETMASYDISFDGVEDFALPPSALEALGSHESEPLDLVDEMYSNVWADEKS